MKILLDTHILVYLSQGNLSDARLRILKDSANRLYFSSFSLWEITKLYELGRIKFGSGIKEYLQKFERHPNLTTVPFDSAVLTRVVEIAPKLHRDPVDQVLIASAIEIGATIMTDDKEITRAKMCETI